MVLAIVMKDHLAGDPRQPRRAQKSPGEHRKAQESTGEPRRAQESTGEPRRAQESPGEHRERRRARSSAQDRAGKPAQSTQYVQESAQQVTETLKNHRGA